MISEKKSNGELDNIKIESVDLIELLSSLGVVKQFDQKYHIEPKYQVEHASPQPNEIIDITDTIDSRKEE